MKRIYTALIGLFFLSTVVAQSGDSVRVFAYFKNNGQDGLHRAYSFDGYNGKH